MAVIGATCGSLNFLLSEDLVVGGCCYLGLSKLSNLINFGSRFFVGTSASGLGSGSTKEIYFVKVCSSI